MYWIILFIAGLFEIAWAVGLKYTEGFSRLWPSVFTILSMIISMGLLAYSVKHLPIGTAYAVWTGIGAVGSVLVGILVFKEPATFWRVFFISSLIISIIGLKVVTK